MKTVKFGNPGEIDPRMWSTFGVSAKDCDNPIGQFGTGLKYAIAVLMREGRSMRIVSGGNEYTFGCESTKIRDTEFEQITCNGEPMPYTTHLGSKWELWQAYRELYSNCLDEGGDIDYDGDTVIYAEIGDIEHGDVFLDVSNRRLLGSSRYCDIYAGPSRYVYNKGIRASEVTRDTLFTYNIKDADLTEDRTFKYGFQVHEAIARTVLQSDEDDLVIPFFMHSKSHYEENVSFEHASCKPSARILDLAAQYRKDSIYLHDGMLKTAISHLGGIQYEPLEMDDRQVRVVEKARNFCELIGYKIGFPVYLADNLGDGTLAVADRKKNIIYLSDTVLSQGSKQVASTLIEEHLHLSKGLDDCTYNMQSYLFDQIVTMGEKLTGEIL